MLQCFVFVSRSKTTHIAPFLFSDSCFSAAQTAKISLLPFTVASLGQPPILHARYNCRPSVFIVVGCTARQADRNSETVKHFRNCIFRSFAHHTIQISGSIVTGRSERWARQCADTKLSISAYNFCARKLCRPITLQPSVAIATCRKTNFPQFVLIQYKAKPYFGFQNLGCHCKILGCHFDTQKLLEKHCTTVSIRSQTKLRRHFFNCQYPYIFMKAKNCTKNVLFSETDVCFVNHKITVFTSQNTVLDESLVWDRAALDFAVMSFRLSWINCNL